MLRYLLRSQVLGTFELTIAPICYNVTFMAAPISPSGGRPRGAKSKPRQTLFAAGFITHEHCELARRLCLLGADDVILAEVFGISESTLNKWKCQSPEFKDALRQGKVVADAAVAAALYKSAVGYRATNVTIIESERGSKTVRTEVDVPPDSRAAVHWLACRQPQQWALNKNEPPLDPVAISKADAALEALIGAPMRRGGGVKRLNDYSKHQNP
jgi:hypothetical protein